MPTVRKSMQDLGASMLRKRSGTNYALKSIKQRRPKVKRVRKTVTQGSAMQSLGLSQIRKGPKALETELQSITAKQALQTHAVAPGTKGETFKQNIMTALHEAGATEEQIAAIEQMDAENIWYLWRMGYIGGQEDFFDYDFVYDEWMDEFRAITQTRTVGMRRAQDLIDTYNMMF